jgi:hypothetical protein
MDRVRHRSSPSYERFLGSFLLPRPPATSPPRRLRPSQKPAQRQAPLRICCCAWSGSAGDTSESTPPAEDDTEWLPPTPLICAASPPCIRDLSAASVSLQECEDKDLKCKASLPPGGQRGLPHLVRSASPARGSSAPPRTFVLSAPSVVAGRRRAAGGSAPVLLLCF